MSPCAAASYKSAQALGKCGPSQYVGQTMGSYDDRSQDETTQGKIRRIEGQALTEKQWNSHGDHVRNVLTYLLHGEESFLRSRLVLQLIKKFPAFYGTRKFVTVLTSARQLPLFWVNSIQSPQHLPTSWRSILILSSHLCTATLY